VEAVEVDMEHLLILVVEEEQADFALVQVLQ
jgi:hypothetical protein